MKEPYWYFKECENGEFHIESWNQNHWAYIPPDGGTNDNCPQQRSIGIFLKMCGVRGWLDDND